MLKWRVITAVILIPILLAAIIFLNSILFNWLALFIVGWAYWEWSGFCRFPKNRFRPIYRALYVILGLASAILLPFISVVYLMAAAAIFWVIAAIGMIVYQRHPTFRIEEHRSVGFSILAGVAGIFVLSFFWIGLVFTRDIPFFGIPLLIFALLLIFVTDTTAYFVGRASGKNKLALKISPGKTWEGYLGGMCGATFIGCLGAWYFWPTTKTRVFFALLCIFIGAMSVVGDLLESFFKRYADLKDAGKLLPGHGGLLDRLDSVSVSLPIFALGLMLMQWL